MVALLTRRRALYRKPDPQPRRFGLGTVPQPTAAYLFDRGPGPSIDHAGRGGTGLLVSNATPPWSPKYGGSFGFNGSTQYLSGTAPAIANVPFTISVLFLPGNQSLDSCVLSMGSSSSTDNLIHIIAKAGATGTGFNMWSDDLPSSVHLSDTGLYRLTCTLDAAKLQTLYLMGDLTDTVSRPASGFYTGDTTLHVGRRNNGGGDDWFAGTVIDLFIWKGIALTAAQVKAHQATPYMWWQTRTLQRWWVVAAAAGSTTYTQTVTATQTQTALLSKRANLIRPLTQAQAASLVKQPNLIRLATQAQTVALQKQANLTRSASQSQAVNVTSLKVLIRIVTATQAQVATLVKTVQSIRSVSQTQTLTVVKQANLTRALSQAQAATLQKQVNLTRSASQAQAASITTLKVLIRIVTASQAQVASLVKSVILTRSAAQPQAVTLTKLATLTRLLSQAQNAVLGWLKIPVGGAGLPYRRTFTGQPTIRHTLDGEPD